MNNQQYMTIGHNCVYDEDENGFVTVVAMARIDTVSYDDNNVCVGTCVNSIDRFYFTCKSDEHAKEMCAKLRDAVIAYHERQD